MHLKVFVKLKKTLTTLSSGQKNPKKTKKTQKTQKKTKKPKKNPLGWVFLKKPGFFPTLVVIVIKQTQWEYILIQNKPTCIIPRKRKISKDFKYEDIPVTAVSIQLKQENEKTRYSILFYSIHLNTVSIKELLNPSRRANKSNGLQMNWRQKVLSSAYVPTTF
jgi:hypothetical protein